MNRKLPMKVLDMKRGYIDTSKGIQWLSLIFLDTKKLRWLSLTAIKLHSVKTVITGTTEIKLIHILCLNMNFEEFQIKEYTVLTYKG